MHRIVSELYKLHPFDVSETVFFNVDELTNLPRSYEGSCYAMIRSQLLDHLGVPDERFLSRLRRATISNWRAENLRTVSESTAARIWRFWESAGTAILESISRELHLAVIPGVAYG